MNQTACTLFQPPPCTACNPPVPATPLSEVNRPGLSRLSYRVGVFSAFRQAMLDYLVVNPVVSADRTNPSVSNRLATWSSDDYGVAICEMWAYVCDVLTFYQQAAANESYLRTAQLPESLARLGFLLGYQPSRGLAASTLLALLADAGALPTLPGGLGVQSIPPPGQTPVVFEFSQPLTINPKANQPQLLGELVQATSTTSAEFLGDSNGPPIVVGTKLVFFNNSTVVADQVVASVTAADRGGKLITWGGALPQPLTSGMQVARYGRKFKLFGANAPHSIPVLSNNGTKWFTFNTASTTSIQAQTGNVYLDGTYDGISTGGKVLIYAAGANPVFIFATILSVAVGQGSVAAQPSCTPPPGFPPSATVVQGACTVLSVNPASSFTVPLQGCVIYEILGGLLSFQQNVDSDQIAAGSNSLNLVDGSGLQAGTQMILVSPVALVTDSFSSPTYAATLSQNPANDFSVQVSVAGSALLASDYTVVTSMINSVATSRVTFSSPPAGAVQVIYTVPGGIQVIDNPMLCYTVVLTENPLDNSTVTVTVGGAALASTAFSLETDMVNNVEVTLVRLNQAPFGAIQVNYQATGTVSDVVTVNGAPARNSDGSWTVNITPNLGNGYQASLTMLYANVVPATQGQTQIEQVLGSGDASQQWLEFKVPITPVTYIPDAAGAGGATSTLSVFVDEIEWTEVSTFYGHGPDETIFTTRVDDSGGLYVRFGNGVTGRRPTTGQANITAQMRKGLGSNGNVAAGTITTMLQPQPGLKSVLNPLPAYLGADAEDASAIRQNAPSSVVTLGRAVSLNDYAALALTYRGGVAKANASWVDFCGRRGVQLTVAPAGGGSLTQPLTASLLHFLNDHRDPNVPLRIVSAAAVPFVFSATIYVLAGNKQSLVQAAVNAAFGPGGDTGYLSFANLQFGQSMFPSALISVLQGVPGVDWVELLDFYEANPNGTHGYGSAPLQQALILGPGEIAQPVLAANLNGGSAVCLQYSGGIADLNNGIICT